MSTINLELTYGDPCLVRVWDIVDGQPKCVTDAIPVTHSDVRQVMAKGTAIDELVYEVEQYEQAQLASVAEPDNGEPKTIPELDDEGNPTGEMVDNPDWKLLPKTMYLTDPETGEQLDSRGPRPEWEAYNAAKSIVDNAPLEVKALALWRAGEPAAVLEDGEPNPEHDYWLGAQETVHDYIEQQAVAIADEIEVPYTGITVSSRQARLALQVTGRLEAVEQIMQNAPKEAQIEWDYTSTVDRTHPIVLQMASVLGLTDNDLDQLFALAATL